MKQLQAIILKHLILQSPEQSIAVQFIKKYVSSKDNHAKLLGYRDRNGWSLLHIALLSQKDVIIKELFKHYSKLFEQEYPEYLELAYFCAKFNCCSSMKTLFELLKFDDKLQLGRALLCAAESNFVEFVRLIILNKNEVGHFNGLNNRFGESLIHIAIKIQSPELFDLVISLGDVDSLNAKEMKYGDTPLLSCCKLLQKGDDEDSIVNMMAMADTLLQQGSDPNLPNDKGITPLHVAVYYANETLIYLLLKYSAKVDTPSKEGNIPLLMAINHASSNEDSILLMLQQDDIDIKCLEQAFKEARSKKEQNKIILSMLKVAIEDHVKKSKEYLIKSSIAECKPLSPRL